MSDLWGGEADPLSDSLIEAGNVGECFRSLSRALIGRLRRNDPLDLGLVRALSISREYWSGHESAEIAYALGVGSRQLRCRFDSSVGLSPKLLFRVLRFRKSLERLREGKAASWPDLALDLGFYDQSHMIRDFRLFSGLSPSDHL